MNEVNSILINNLKQIHTLLHDIHEVLEDCESLAEKIERPKIKITDGILCPKCAGDTKVIDHRYHKVDGEYIKQRRRECCKCGYRYNTVETPVSEII